MLIAVFIMRYWNRCLLRILLLLPVAAAHAQPIVFVPGKTVPYSSSATVTTLAGAADSKGSTDAVGPDARFAWPMGLAVAPDGTLYVVDEENMTVRKITATGAVTTLAGTAGSKGSADSAGPAARFYHPVGLALDAGGMLYVTDADNHTIRKVSPAGEVTTLAGAPGRKGSADGSGATAQFNLPHGMAVDASGTVYVADTENHTIRKITPAGAVSTLAGAARHKGSVDGQGANARFYHPAAVAVDGAGNVYVADNGNHTIRKIGADGTVTTLAGHAKRHGGADGPGASARFFFPTGLAVDAIGNVYVADYLNANIRKISPTGEMSTLAGAVLQGGHLDGPGPDARFQGPSGIAVDANGTLYVTDGPTVRVIKQF
ncbi:NHL repeat-containing protein [Hymenobacter convexus]|uniref:NHL repeat-containing protein n=1 Tax=Hymenobacter sp. CA1UV-4 TaxID=3063782 RepID=UPI002712B065|nr:NHL repeat-containing protein [Hymenobacter sp. CA1UV-4]MDO7851257.1 NHL repeat-containing protein [Hymenobacter sp. CA1UV-4]